MRKYLLFILLVITACATPRAAAQRAAMPNDTVMLYLSWDAILDAAPDTMLINPEIEVHSPYDYYFKSTTKGDKRTKKLLNDSTVAVTIGDSIWLINSRYLKREFSGEAKKFDRFVPMYFNSKILFVQYIDITNYISNEMLSAMFFSGYTMAEIYDELEAAIGAAPFFLVDFSGKTVYRVDEQLLTQLLEEYPDLLRRYSQMRDYRETYMINSFFLDYVNRIEYDPDVPFLDPY